MTKSRQAAGLLLLVWAGEGTAAEPLTAEQALTAYRREFRPVEDLRCPPGSSPGEVVVCGRREGRDPNRVPLPDLREPGERVRLLPGEPPGGAAALAMATADPCRMAGPNHPCGGSITLISKDPDQHTFFGTLFKVAHHLLGGDR